MKEAAEKKAMLKAQHKQSKKGSKGDHSNSKASMRSSGKNSMTEKDGKKSVASD